MHCITTANEPDIESLATMFRVVLDEDIARFGNQHPEFTSNPVNELRLGLEELESNPLFRKRFENFVTPMVFNQQPHNFELCFTSFKRIAESLINTIQPI